jgi:hypothetical protein
MLEQTNDRSTKMKAEDQIPNVWSALRSSGESMTSFSCQDGDNGLGSWDLLTK